MRLKDLDIVRLLPAFMREDATVRALAKGVNIIVKDLEGNVQRLSTWDKIDELGDLELDEMAWELNITWYDKAAPLDVKRTVIRDADMVSAKLGTKWAVENVISAYFGVGKVEEWFDYEGEPYHFRVVTSNPSVTNERMQEFLALLQKVKRASCVLDTVIITLTGDLKLYAGFGLHVYGRKRFYIGAKRG